VTIDLVDTFNELNEFAQTGIARGTIADGGERPAK
jgi:hypothetical protein